jgi:hypothetical protein
MPSHFRRFVSATTNPGVILLREGASIASTIEELLLIWSAVMPRIGLIGSVLQSNLQTVSEESNQHVSIGPVLELVIDRPDA